MRSYRKALQYILKGHIDLVLCICDTVRNNKILTMLVVSLMLNISLIIALANERIERDKMNAELTHLQMLKDSLNKQTYTNISFRYN